MSLFEDKPRTASDAAFHAETTFAYLDRSGRRIMAAQRELLETWFERYPREHRAHSEMEAALAAWSASQ
jgi:hypothetical protein